MDKLYLDYAATTPLHPEVVEEMQRYLTIDQHFGNASSQHAFGKAAQEAIQNARSQVADMIHAEPSEIIWTSGATEANNLAIKGIAELYKNKGKHIITMTTEHKAVLDPCMHLEKNGFSVTYLPSLANGLLSIDMLEKAIRPDTILVSIMAVNNETGIIQDLMSIRELTQQRGIFLHTDAVQAIGKIKLDIRDIPMDLISMTAHKVYGPKGIGALYIRKRPRIRVMPLIHGGGQEHGMRSGTLPTHQIAGMGKAFAL
ncbi:MAG TPA: aminotransferase class V-fold PLP-dependent enzyme, partial [Myxococcota bacterium]|nr:aminotransferase class V-fold PLP-dependent enzyme [Myxococcota bacterium]